MSQVIIDAMYSLGKSDAKDLRMRAHSMDGTAIIAEESKIPDFDPNKDYSECPVGTPTQDFGQIYKLLQPYNAKNYEGRPADLPAIWSVQHTTDPEKAKPWMEPQGTSGMYMKGECYRKLDGRVKRAKRNNLVYNADALPDAWEDA